MYIRLLPSLAITTLLCLDPLLAAVSLGGHYRDTEIDVYLPQLAPSGISRIYRSNITTKGIFGIGWFSLLDQKLILGKTKQLPIQMMTDKDYGLETFNYQSGIKHHASHYLGNIHPDDKLIATKNGYTLQTGSKFRRSLFDHKGRLLRIENGHGKSVELLWSKKLLIGLRSSTGKRWTFEYDFHQRLTSISTLQNRKKIPLVDYSYHNGRLAKVKVKSLPTLRYTYNSKSQLIRIKNKNQTQRDINITYKPNHTGTVLAIKTNRHQAQLFENINSISSNKQYTLNETINRSPNAIINKKIGAKIKSRKSKKSTKLLVTKKPLSIGNMIVYNVKQIISKHTSTAKTNFQVIHPGRCCSQFKETRPKWGSVVVSYNKYGQETKLVLTKNKIEVKSEYKGPRRRLTKNVVRELRSKKILTQLSVRYSKNGLPESINSRYGSFSLAYNSSGDLVLLEGSWQSPLYPGAAPIQSKQKSLKHGIARQQNHSIRFLYDNKLKLRQIVSKKYGRSHLNSIKSKPNSRQGKIKLLRNKNLPFTQIEIARITRAIANLIKTELQYNTRIRL